WRKFAARVTAVTALALLLCAPGATARAQSLNAGSPDLVISQVYTRGGESGAAFHNDYVEIFNAGTVPVDMEGWSVHIRGFAHDPTSFGRVFFPFSRHVEPGHYVLVRLGTGGPNGAALPPAEAGVIIFDELFNVSAGGAEVALLPPDAPDPPRTSNGCPALPSANIADFVGYGNAACSEGGSAAPAPGLTTALFRRSNGCEETDRNNADFQLLDAAPRNSSSPPAPCGPAQHLSFFNFASTGFAGSETQTSAQVAVRRTGNLSEPATVDYVVVDGTASERSDYTSAAGRLRFAAGEAQKTFDVLITNDARQEQIETAEVRLSNATGVGASVGLRDKAPLSIIDDDNPPPSSNPADDSLFFVRQHYHDFLGRSPDTAGLVFWRNNIESCGADLQCREVKRVDTSAAFFLSIEFQRTGFLVHRLYRAALPETAARPRGLPRYHEFIRDTQELGRGVVVGQTGWEQTLEANTQLLLADFVARPEFLAAYPQTLSAAEYVDALDAHAAGVIGGASVLTPQQRDALVAGLQNGTETRATVLRKVAETQVFSDAEKNRAFVLMQYIGYLRRHPLDQPDLSFDGYDFWLAKLNAFNGNYVDAEMVKAFITSIEYRRRFGQ
ncbi:MAG TPA: Calx-beta domain-containing protein, partial [Pyrinomonadaceae bacterium]